jgi:vacuolar-type H+-ATPase subunit H
MKNEIAQAIAIRATGRMSRKARRNAKQDMALATASVALARSVAKANPEATTAAAALSSSGVPSTKKPLDLAIAKAVTKLPNGELAAAEAYLRAAMAPTKSGRKGRRNKKENRKEAGKLNLTAEQKKARSGAAHDATVDYSIKELKSTEKLTDEDWDSWEKREMDKPSDMDREHSPLIAYAGSLMGGVVVHGAVSTAIGVGGIAAAAAGTIGVMGAVGLVMGAPVLALGVMGVGYLGFTAGSMLIDAATDVATAIAKGVYGEAKAAHDDVMDKAGQVSKMAGDAKSAISSAAGDASAAFDAAKNAMGQTARDTNTTLAELGKAFDDTIAAAEKYIDDLPENARKDLESAWAEAEKLGDAVEKEMSSLGSKMMDLAKGMVKALSSKEESKKITPKDMVKEGLKGVKVKSEGSSVIVKPFPKEPILDTLGQVDKLQADAMKAAKPLMAKANKAIDQATAAATKEFEKVSKALDSAAKSATDKINAGMDALSSLWGAAEESLSSLSDLADEEAAKSGKVWVDGHVRQDGSKVKGFWRKVAEGVWGKRIIN